MEIQHDISQILFSLKQNSSRIIDDLEILNNSIKEIEVYKNTNIDISHIYINIKEHIDNINICLNSFKLNIKLINDKLKNDTIKINTKTTSFISTKKQKKNSCCCYFI